MWPQPRWLKRWLRLNILEPAFLKNKISEYYYFWSVRCGRQLKSKTLKKPSCGIWVHQKEAVGRRLGRLCLPSPKPQVPGCFLGETLTNKVLRSKMRTRCSAFPKVPAVTLLRFWPLHKVGAATDPQAH